MTKKNGTKRSLLMSVLALVLCFSMLIGSTFAWFTDSVTSGTNQIVAGNLDVELYHADKAQPTDALVGSNTTLFDDVSLWEPGVMVWEKLTVKNAGSLDLKYNLSINISEIAEVNGKSLKDVLKVAVLTEAPTRDNVASAATQSLATFNLASDKALTAGNSEVKYVAIYWAPSANDNDYNVANKALYAKLGVILSATQYTAESDSFDSQYDKDATYDGSVATGNTVIVSTSTTLPAAPTAPVTVATEEVEVAVPVAVVEALVDESVTSVAVAHTEPVVDTVNNTITFDAVDLVDQNNNVIDLEGNTTDIEVTLNVGAAFDVGDVVEIYHDDEKVATATVDADKNVTYNVKHFCEVTIVPAPTSVSTVAELIAALNAGENVALAADIDLTSTLLVKKDVVIDLNGKTMTAPSSGVMFQSQSNAAPSMTITSSVAGAKINAGNNAVLLGYGSTEISNVEINVGTIKSSSNSTFQVYGDLTLGEGTVVNVEYLGTSLISNNGAVAIVIDGAEINVDTFKVNGGAMISINQATTVELSDTEVTVGLDTTYTSYFVSQENKAAIDNCTFNVTGTNGVNYTVSETGKQWVVVD